MRRQAEMRCQAESVKPLTYPGPATGDTAHIVHELHVHQIELELQNEELRRVGIALEESRARYFDLYDLAPMGFCSIDERGLIFDANLATATLLGMTRSALLKQALSRFVCQEDQDAYFLWRKQILHNESLQSCEIRMNNGGGRPFWAMLNASVIRRAHDKLVLQIVLSDVTERKNTEIALQEAQQRLRHFTLHQQEEFDELRAELARDVHDQLGQTLAAMKLKTELIRDIAPEVAQHMQQLVKEGVASVRDISRALRPVALDMGLTHALRALAADLSKHCDVDISTQLPENLPDLPGQTERGLYRIAQEALSNAVAHAQAHKIEINLRLLHDQLELTVNDDGQGFAPNSKSVHRGLGLLGMRERAKQLGAVLWIQSKPLQGTSIQLTIGKAFN
jgi:PAS domain S-box-containing protein